MNSYDRIISCVRRLPSLQLGLKWFPNLEPRVNNNQDMPPFGFPPDAEEISDCNHQVLINALDQLGDQALNILEIGVSRNGARSFTNVIHAHRRAHSRYLGVDKQARSGIQDPDTHSYFLQADSSDQDLVRARLQELDMHTLDLILIDGWHSVNQTVNDWAYVDLLRVGGIVIMHDTNAHPGPVALYDAVNEQQFEKHRYCTQLNDMGISMFRRLS
jgi:hypothetical protein